MKYKQNFDEQKKEYIRKSKTFRKTLLRDAPKNVDNFLQGRVVEVKPKYYVVEELHTKTLYSCFAAGRISSPHKFSNLIACGDYVCFTLDDSSSNEQSGLIFQVEERKTKLSRRDPANPNREHVISSNNTHLLIFMSIDEPLINLRLIDRILVAAELGKLEPIICINKIDLVEFDEVSDMFDPYRALQIPLFPISVSENFALNELYSFIKGKDTVIVGMSGVGKSSLINNIFGSEVQSIADVSEWSGKGRHTTSIVRRFELPFGGYLTDTPGLREYALWDVSKDEICLLFPDFRQYINDCKFSACTHTHEPGCSVKLAVDKNKISFERYQSYLNIYDSLDD
ncbi:MAG: ribosome small subunit-dependent GTPase A [Ignavibacteria bacterium]|nr:ribosome small subunit-dependent GTPase A [Ignavibacteria bacterium]